MSFKRKTTAGLLGTDKGGLIIYCQDLHIELDKAYAEIRKQVHATKAVFDRELVERAKGAKE